ncbi:MAG: hypothetical protein M1833_004452 [Piccolia ochrophora]|nr:MAG: hypothetical protein M1833_004452 [Piccolia ochrophora]
MDYMEDEAYVDMKESPDHALAILFFAENLRLQDLWTEAFVHCTGMNERLVASLEFEPVSRISKALITRAKLEMDIRLDHAEKLLTSFLDTELSGTYLGLAHGARVHLDRFRSFLLAHYVGKFGYWPPAQSADGKEAISKSLFRSMYFEFRNLYEYLVDNDSTADIGNNARPASGGLCVHQNLAAFDKRNRYTSLPHPLPLVPENPEALDRQRPFERFSRSFSKSAKAERKIATLAALSAATNSTNDTVMESSLVRAYMRFEKEITIKDEDKVSAADARKVRWILIYAVLQTLISVTRAPHEVRDTEGVSYNLCVQIAGTPPWTLDGSDTDCKSPVEESTTPKEEIKPDTDYFAYKTAFSGDVTVKHPQPRKLGFCEILVHRYGNGTINAEDVSPSSGASSTPSLSVDDQTISETSESRWSPSITGDDVDFSVADMDHLRITSPSSVYGTEEPVAVAEFTPKPLEMRKDACASMDTLALRRSLNPEVERYVAAV